MQIEYDEAKNERNVRERSLGFDRAKDFEFVTASIQPYFRNGEWRQLALGYLDGRLHVLCFTWIADGIRVISFRKAKRKGGGSKW